MLKCINQIDHIPIESKHVTYVLNARSRTETDSNTDHMLVRATIKCRMEEMKKEKIQSRYSVEKLNNEDILRKSSRDDLTYEKFIGTSRLKGQNNNKIRWYFVRTNNWWE